MTPAPSLSLLPDLHQAAYGFPPYCLIMLAIHSGATPHKRLVVRLVK